MKSKVNLLKELFIAIVVFVFSYLAYNSEYIAISMLLLFFACALTVFSFKTYTLINELLI